MSSHAFILEFQLKASIEEVMGLLTDEDLIEAWSGGSSLIEKFEGGKFVMFDGWVEGKVMKITDDELAYTWKPSDWADDTPPSSVHYKLIKDGDETKIVHLVRQAVELVRLAQLIEQAKVLGPTELAGCDGGPARKDEGGSKR